MTAILVDHNKIVDSKKIATFVELHQLNDDVKECMGNSHWIVVPPELNYAQVMQSQ